MIMTPAEKTLERVRAISEGRLKLRTVRTVRLAAFVTPPAPRPHPDHVFRYATLKTEIQGETL